LKLGTFVPQLGPAASGEAIVTVAKHAEKAGFDCVWVTDRLLFPVEPKSPYGASPDGKLPDVYKIVYEPLEALVWVAANTKTIGLGTSVLDMPFYNPITLARRTSTIDVLSGGRLRLGFGQGWSQDEYEATNADASKRGKRADEFLQVLKAVWTQEPAEFHGKFFQLNKSHIGPKPVQKGGPPVYLAAFAPPALKRVATLADGWHPVGLPVGAMQAMWGSVKEMAKAAGRNPKDLALSVRGNLHITDTPLGDDRWIFSGSPDQITADIAAVRDLGANELALDPTFSPGLKTADDFIRVIDEVKDWAK
jgi:probable F420-dependent oxidoreductase